MKINLSSIVHQFILCGILYNAPISWAYRKYYVEDECNSPNKFQNIFFRLPASGPDSVGELRPNRFGTYSRMGRNCLIKLVPPKGYGIVLTVLKIDFRNHEGCKDYIKIYDSDDDGEKLCGYHEIGMDGKTYFSDDELRILYHTSEGGMGFSNGFKLVFTVTTLDEESGACAAPDQFKCENFRCIWAGVKCDGINNCGDASDESSSDQAQCRTYQQIYKNFFNRLDDITPVAITAIVLGITTFIAIVIVMCLCCCRVPPEKPIKPYFIDDIPVRPNAGYIPLPGYSPLPGYNFPTTNNLGLHPQPVHSSPVQPSAPRYYAANYPQNPSAPYMHQKIEIRYDRPPPYVG